MNVQYENVPGRHKKSALEDVHEITSLWNSIIPFFLRGQLLAQQKDTKQMELR
jgi:hypothetical protein